jgi:trans-aconitate 2-methyltransferase
MTPPRWDPAQYGRFETERSRPFHDLMARVGATAPAIVVDLGCGPGELTATLATRWPAAAVTGVDSSAEMLAEAAAHASAQLRFVAGDLRTWTPPGPVDVLVANASLQWIAEHPGLLERFVSWLAPEGWFAFQVPGNFASPSHTLLAELRLTPRWRDQVGTDADRHLHVLDPEEYAARLHALGCEVDAWETTYVHVLQGPDPVLQWVMGTGLRPVLTVLAGADQDEFLAQYRAALRAAYPPLPSGVTLFPFRRIFAVAHRTHAAR